MSNLHFLSIIPRAIKRLTILLLTASIPLISLAEDFEYNGLKFNIISETDLTCGVTSNTPKYFGDISIPSSAYYNGKTYKVTEICYNAFSYCKELTSVNIPTSVTSIGERAFENCEGLSSIIIPNSVTKIDRLAFFYCQGLSSVVIPNSITAINDRTFTWCTELTSITIPSTVTYIGEGEFLSCQKLESIDIPNSVQQIGDYAFSDCYGLTSLTIPNSVTQIGRNAFDTCTNLTSASLPNSISTIETETFRCCDKLASISLPSSITSIGDGAFMCCGSLTSITIPYSVTHIGESAFESCVSLTSIYGKYASDDHRCLIIDGKLTTFLSKGLTSYTIPNTVTSIGNNVFSYCEGLNSVIIPSSVNHIGTNAFNYCWGLQWIYIDNTNPNNITLSDETFQILTYNNCVLYVPKGYTNTYVADNRWSNFASIEDYEETVSLQYEIIPWEDAKCRVVARKSGRRYSGDMEIPSSTTIDGKTYSVTEIGSSAFTDCIELTAIKLPNTIFTIGENAFSYCTGLTSITIPNSVITIEHSAFYGCTRLSEVIFSESLLSESLLSIGGNCFTNCTSLTSITIPDNVTSIDLYAFQDCDALTAFYGKYASEDHRCLIIDGELNSFAQCGITSYTIPSTVTKIGTGVFYSCDNLQTVSIPNTIKEINYWVFAYSGLKSITIPKSVTSIKGLVFHNCNDLEWIKIESNDPSNITLDNQALKVPSDNCILYVPKGSKNLFTSADIWKNFKNIQEYEGVPDYEFTAEDITARRGRINMLPVSMKNISGIISFQCDISLPEGVSVHQENGTYAFEKSDRFDGTHSLSSALQTDGKIRVISYSTSNHEYAGNEGVLFSIPIEVGDELADDSEVTLTISNIKLSIGETMKSYTAKDVNTKITVARKYTPGDVNDDGEFTILDASMVIAYVLGRDPLNGIKEAADVNEDGEITVLDASIVVSYVLNGRPVNGVAKANALVKDAQASEQPSIRFEGGKAYVSIPDASRFVAGQFTLTIPEGVNVSEIKLVGENADTHSLAWRKGDNGVINVATYSLSNSNLSGEDLIEITFAHNCHAGEIAVSNVLMISTDNDYYEELAFAPAYANIGTDGITDTTNELIIYAEGHNLVVISPTETTLTIASVDGKWHTLDATIGKNTYTLNAGLYFVNNHKIIIK